MKTITKKRNSVIFLATILLAAGTIALSSPSFITNAQAFQQDYYYGGMDNNGYEQQPYGTERYDERSSYDRNYNYYEPTREYSSPSYQKEYKSDYSSYGKDNYKSKKDTSDSVSINKLKCINNNVNINGNNNGTINVGNSGSLAATNGGTDGGYVGVGSLGGNNGEGYNGYKKQKDQGFTCIINNNNNNTNVVGDTGNETEPLTCVECFREFLTPDEIVELGTQLEIQLDLTIAQYCDLADRMSLGEESFRFFFEQTIGVEEDRVNLIIECLLEAGIVFAP